MAGFKRRTLEELLSVDIAKLTKAELQGYKKVARDEVARLARKWEKEDYKPPAYYGLEKATGGTKKISFKGKDTLQQQKKELAKAINILKDPTRTKTGFETEKQRNINIVNEQIKKKVHKGRGNKRDTFDEMDFDRLYKAYEKAKELDKNIMNAEYKYSVFEAMVTSIEDENKSIDELAIEMQNLLEDAIKDKEIQHQKNIENQSELFE